MPPQQLHTFLRFGGGVRTTSGVFSVRVWFQRCLSFAFGAIVSLSFQAGECAANGKDDQERYDTCQGDSGGVHDVLSASSTVVIASPLFTIADENLKSL